MFRIKMTCGKCGIVNTIDLSAVVLYRGSYNPRHKVFTMPPQQCTECFSLVTLEVVECDDEPE